MWKIFCNFSSFFCHLPPAAMVNITEDPQSTEPLLVGETAMFTCQARSIPSPSITWFRFQNGMEVELVDNDNITITSQSQPEDNFTTRSVLSVRVTGDEDFTEYFCVGDNQFDNSTSDNATLVQAGMYLVMSVWIIKVDHVQSLHPLFTPSSSHLLPHLQFLPHSLRTHPMLQEPLVTSSVSTAQQLAYPSPPPLSGRTGREVTSLMMRCTTLRPWWLRTLSVCWSL